MYNILVLAEHVEGKIKKTTLELVGKASLLAKELGGSINVCLIGSKTESEVHALAAYGAQKVFLVNQDQLEKYNTIAYTQVLAQVVSESKPTILLATASPMGKDLFPRLAARLKAGLVTDCIELKINQGKLIAKKPVYSGKAFATGHFNTPIQMATTRPNSFPMIVADPNAKAEISSVTFDPGTLCAEIKEVVQGLVGKTDLTVAEIIVSGGRAMGKSENFQVLQALADVIGATVGASRAAVDSGYAPHDMQVGQTGKVVNPKLYIACGISGAIQHLAGMRTSKVIVAINKDPEAPIFSKADYGIVGDLFTIVPLLTEEFRKLLSES